MTVRKASAEWKGSLEEGQGHLNLGSGAFEGEYSFRSRFQSGEGTNPEEMIGAALAGCFSMALAHQLAQGGYKPKSILTDAKVHLEKRGNGFEIPRIELNVEAEIPEIKKQSFMEYVRMVEEGCPVSKALKAVEITIQAKLVG